MDFSTASFDLIKHDLNNARTVNSDQVLYNRIKEAGDSRAQLQKAAEEFEAIFITKMLTEMDKTVDREGGLFGEKSQYVDTFKSIVYQQIGHDIASNPHTSMGMAQQIYKQMERYVGN
jgi:Rod binding domain-containing protein